MEILIIALAVIQSFAISLGVGSSTLAVVGFFVAIFDGTIDATERKMMGVWYSILRISMMAILCTTATVAVVMILSSGAASVALYTVEQLVLTLVLFINASLMTVRLMPSSFGPAIQAGSWYALGLLAALNAQDADSFTFTQFILGYIALVAACVCLINSYMAYLKQKPKPL